MPTRPEQGTMLQVPQLDSPIPAPGGQARLCQADARTQCQHHLAESIVSLTIRGSLHGRSPFRVTHRSKTLESDRHTVSVGSALQVGQRLSGLSGDNLPFTTSSIYLLYHSRFSSAQRASCSCSSRCLLPRSQNFM